MSQTDHTQIRRIQIRIDYANAGKIEQLDLVMRESIRVVNLYIDALWEQPKVKFVSFKVDTWLSARMQQCLGKQANGIVKSAKARLKAGKKASKPVFNRPVINFDSRFCEFDLSPETVKYDFWLHLSSLGDEIGLNLPGKRHKHLLQFLSDGWSLSKSCRLRKHGDVYYVDLYVEKEIKHVRQKAPKTIGIDCGYKRLLVTSENNIYGEELEAVYEKLAKKKRGSKNYEQTLQYRDNLVGQAVNRCLNAECPDAVFVEALLNVKHKTKQKKRLSTKFVSKLQYWVYRKTLDKIQNKCQVKGIYLGHVDPKYTSRICPVCGCNDKASRRGITFRCTSCGYEADADTNAAVNIRNRGVYSPSD